jgi:hypothetical protein
MSIGVEFRTREIVTVRKTGAGDEREKDLHARVKAGKA